MIETDVLKKYQEAGRIASEVRNAGRKLVTVGASVLEICEKLEEMIVEKEGSPAFPVNICINEVAAHYSSPPKGTVRIPAQSLVKLDVGVHIDGYIADTATSIALGIEHEEMIRSVEDGLEHSIKMIKANVKASEIGGVIERTVKRYGYKPIWNLTGHQMVRYNLHTGRSIPNVSRINGSRLHVGEVFAVEPFVTSSKAAGEVVGAKEAHIYRLQKERSVKDKMAKKLMNLIKFKFKNLPFSLRWIKNDFPSEYISPAFSKLLSVKNVTAYPVLLEKTNEVVAQAEHTIIITDDGCIVTTR